MHEFHPGDLVAIAILDGTRGYVPTGRYDMGEVLSRHFDGNGAPALLNVLWADGTRCAVSEAEAIHPVYASCYADGVECCSQFVGETTEILEEILANHRQWHHTAAPTSPLYGNLPTDIATTPPTVDELVAARQASR